MRRKLIDGGLFWNPTSWSLGMHVMRPTGRVPRASWIAVQLQVGHWIFVVHFMTRMLTRDEAFARDLGQRMRVYPGGCGTGGCGTGVSPVNPSSN